MTYRLICADVMDGVASLADESVNCVVTSPPYFGLRDYQTATWEGGEADCDHKKISDPVSAVASSTLGGGKKTTGHQQEGYVSRCARCGARRVDEQVGLEKSPEEYVSRLVDVFREMRRVLKNDGVLWLNLGDSYAGSWGNQGRKETRGTQRPINGEMMQSFSGYGDLSELKNTGSWVNRHPVLKPKDLIGIPWRVAFALQSDGWYLRADIIWAKGNTMPESVTDRPTKSHEYLFLLTKSDRYYYDQDAIREPYVGLNQHDVTGPGYSAPGQTRQAGNRSDSHKGSSFTHGKTGINGQGRVSEAERVDNPLGRNKRSVWTVNTQPFPGSHFAVMPEKLVEPCILAGCPEGGTVLDPFSGSGTVGVVALGHGRKFVGIDLNPAYIEMARNRIHNSAPLLNLEVA